MNKDFNQNNFESKTIIFSGGGTGGSITPLLALAEELWKKNESLGNLKENLKLVFIGNHYGPEQEMVAEFNNNIAPLKFIPLTSGKWRRYFSLQNFTDIFKIIYAYFKSFKILRRLRPNLIISVGGFVSVPLVWAAATKRIPILIHQQDIRPGLANRLMAPFARIITVSFEKSLADYGSRALWIGNPVKALDFNNSVEKIAKIKNKYQLNSKLPLILVAGGGTGSQAINDLIFKSQLALGEFTQIFHISGRGKGHSNLKVSSNYISREMLSHDDFLDLQLAADIVISRCGLGTLSELSALKKVAILIPMPNSHQEDNAQIFAEAQAALVLKQKNLNSEKLLLAVKKVLTDQDLRKKYRNNIAKIIKPGARKRLVEMIEKIIK